MKVGNTHFVESHFVKITLLNVPIAIVTVVSKPHGIWGAREVLRSEVGGYVRLGYASLGQVVRIG